MRDDDLLKIFLEGFLWPDEEWLLFSSDPNDAAAVYWQSQLAIRISVRSLDGGSVKWQVLIRMVEGVTDEQAALETCLALNRLAAGWSYAYDEKNRVVAAIASVRCPHDSTPAALRLSEVVKLGGWLSETVADWLAARVGGVVARCGPEGPNDLRTVPDATFHYARVLRTRPEWVYNLLPLQYPPMQEVADAYADALPEPFRDDIAADDDVLQLLGVHEETGQAWFALVSRFDFHPVFGLGWMADMMLPTMAVGDAARLANRLTWELFYSDETSLLGAWVTTPVGMSFRTWATASELRSYEQINGFTGHDAALLWHVVAAGGDAIWVATAGQIPPVADQQVLDMVVQDSLVDAALNQIVTLAEPLLPIPTPSDTQSAVRRNLWLQNEVTFLTMAWFNPAGPTVATLQVSRSADGRRYLVYLMRHPFVPQYRVLAAIGDDDDVMSALPEAVTQMLGGSPPTAVSVEGCPEHFQQPLVDLLKQRLLLNHPVSDPDNLGRCAARLEAAQGRPWEYASLDSEVGVESPYTTMGAEDQFNAWWNAASDPSHVFAVFRDLPWAWDGAINWQASSGTIDKGYFDMEPLVTVYSQIGRVEDER